MPEAHVLETALIEAWAAEVAARKVRVAIEVALGRGDARVPMIPRQTAVIDWGKSDDTIRRWALAGVIVAEKVGGRWFVQAEPPSYAQFAGVLRTRKSGTSRS